MCYIVINLAIFFFSVSEELHHRTYKNLSSLVGIKEEVVAIVLEVVMLVSGTGRFLDYKELGTFLSLIWYFEGFSGTLFVH